MTSGYGADLDAATVALEGGFMRWLVRFFPREYREAFWRRNRRGSSSVASGARHLLPKITWCVAAAVSARVEAQNGETRRVSHAARGNRRVSERPRRAEN